MRLALIALAFSGLLVTAQAGDKTYRWVDAQGRVHYSDVRAEKGEAVNIRPSNSIQAVPVETAETLAARQLECKRKQTQAAAYANSADITETDGLGKTRTYTAEERQQLIDRTQKQMQEACSKAGALAAAEGSAAQP